MMQSLEEKDLGNTAYKNKEFEAALEHYGKAIQLDPTNITFYTNKAGKVILKFIMFHLWF